MNQDNKPITEEHNYNPGTALVETYSDMRREGIRLVWFALILMIVIAVLIAIFSPESSPPLIPQQETSILTITLEPIKLSNTPKPLI